jgi:hypothetical protein
VGSRSETLDGRVAPVLRVAGALYVANAVGFGVGAVASLWYLGGHGELPMTPFGFRAFSGPFEALGTPRFAALAWTFVGVCAVQARAGSWLWRRERRGAALGLATMPVAAALGAGFALPLYLISIPVELGLLALGRRALR